MIWPVVPLSTIRAPEKYSMVGGPFGSKLVSTDYKSEGVPVIRGTNLPDGKRFSFSDLVFVSRAKVARDLFGNLAAPGDIVVTQRGTLGQVGLIPMDSPFDRFVVSQSQMKLTVDPAKGDATYVYYALRSPFGQQEIVSRAITAGVPHINLSLFQDIQIPLPELSIQQKIATVLSTYDDLIENNNRRIMILEEMAQRIYREWFVDFRYPGREDVRLVESELGAIPGGWRALPLGQVATITMGQSPPSLAYNEAGIGLPFHQGVGTYGEHFPIARVYSTEGGRFANAHDILMSVRAPVGRINVAETRMILGRGLCGISGTSLATTYLLYALKYIFREEDTMGGGSIFKAVTKRDVETIPILCPQPDLIDTFVNGVQPMLSLLESLVLASRNLRATRELLLPRLVSGDINVKDLAIHIPDAAA